MSGTSPRLIAERTFHPLRFESPRKFAFVRGGETNHRAGIFYATAIRVIQERPTAQRHHSGIAVNRRNERGRFFFPEPFLAFRGENGVNGPSFSFLDQFIEIYEGASQLLCDTPTECSLAATRTSVKKDTLHFTGAALTPALRSRLRCVSIRHLKSP